MSVLDDRPLGVGILVAWSGLLGLASIGLAFPGPIWHLPVGILYLAGAYGLWQQSQNGAVVLSVAWFVGAIDYTVTYGAPASVIGALLVSSYLYYRRNVFR